VNFLDILSPPNLGKRGGVSSLQNSKNFATSRYSETSGRKIGTLWDVSGRFGTLRALCVTDFALRGGAS
jgi:hypothetical protein